MNRGAVMAGLLVFVLAGFGTTLEQDGAGQEKKVNERAMGRRDRAGLSSIRGVPTMPRPPLRRNGRVAGNDHGSEAHGAH